MGGFIFKIAKQLWGFAKLAIHFISCYCVSYKLAKKVTDVLTFLEMRIDSIFSKELGGP
jgi:hypothetical protein